MRRALALLATTFVAAALVGCTDTGNKPATPALKLVSYTSCDELLASVRDAAKRSVGPYGFGTDGRGPVFSAVPPQAAERADAATAPGAKVPVQGQDYSGTNTHELGVDEPDLVKTDGNRILVVQNGTLHIIDAASHSEIHQMRVDPGASQLLMQGDRVLVLSQGSGEPIPLVEPERVAPTHIFRASTLVQLVDISGAPKVVGEYKIGASLVDARQTGSTARIVVRNMPAIDFPTFRDKHGDRMGIDANREAIDQAPLDKWLPEITVNGQSKTLDCADISRPQEFSGASLVTLLSFDLGASTLSEGEPIAVLADGETVYGSGPNLYLANDQHWRAWRSDTWNPTTFRSQTDLYQFDITTPQPSYVASGTVPGWLLNQYSMSEFEEVLRVATTNANRDESTVYTLRRNGGELKQTGKVGGLGKNERIYAVRFVGKVGYVVTFRQTDPLYTIDLSDPDRPRVVGELKIAGYSAYLHPVNEFRLIGVGQDATEQGRVQGTQVSLFDVADLADPKRVAQYTVSRAHSEAEHDPHAFLYWPQAKLLVIPVNQDALLLRVEDTTLNEVGWISHNKSYEGQIRRSLVIGDTLWTISQEGAMASSLDGKAELGWVEL